MIFLYKDISENVPKFEKRIKALSLKRNYSSQTSDAFILKSRDIILLTNTYITKFLYDELSIVIA